MQDCKNCSWALQILQDLVDRNIAIMTLEMQPKPIEVDAIAVKHEKDNLLFMYEDAGIAVSSNFAVK